MEVGPAKNGPVELDAVIQGAETHGGGCLDGAKATTREIEPSGIVIACTASRGAGP